MTLVLIRHGRTAANEKRLYCGSTDLPLSPGGAEELKNKRFANLPDISEMRAVTSGMRRCEETLRLLFGDLPHDSDPDFREMDFGAFEMRSYEELKDDPAYIAWISGDNEANAAPGGESGKLMASRVARATERLTADGRDVLLVAHGGVIAAIMAAFFPHENKNRYEWQPAFGEGYTVDLSSGTYSVLS